MSPSPRLPAAVSRALVAVRRRRRLVASARALGWAAVVAAAVAVVAVLLGWLAGTPGAPGPLT